MPKIKRKITRTGAKPTRKQRKIILSDEEKLNRKEEDQKLAEELKNITSYIIAPAGKPPYDLEGTDIDSVRDWVLKIRTTGNHSVQSCTYWVRYFYDINFQKEEYKAVAKIIRDNKEEFGLPDFPYSKKLNYEETKAKVIGW